MKCLGRGEAGEAGEVGEVGEVGVPGLEQDAALAAGSRQQYGSMLRSWSKLTWTPIFSRWFRPDHLGAPTNRNTTLVYKSGSCRIICVCILVVYLKRLRWSRRT